MFFCAMLARVSRFYFMMNSIVPLAKSDAAAIFFWSFFLGAISPFRAGESVRILWARQHGVDVTATAAIWIAERCADLYLITAISLCSAMMVFHYIQVGSAIALGGGSARIAASGYFLPVAQPYHNQDSVFREIAKFININTPLHAKLWVSGRVRLANAIGMANDGVDVLCCL